MKGIVIIKDIFKIGFLMVFITFFTFFTSCSHNEKISVQVGLLNKITLNMNEKEVVSLLGKPDRISKTQYELDNPALAKLLYYTVTDGRKWIIIFDEKDKLIGCGEQYNGVAANSVSASKH